MDLGSRLPTRVEVENSLFNAFKERVSMSSLSLAKDEEVGGELQSFSAFLEPLSFNY